MQAQAQSSDHSLSMGERARGQNRIRHAINPRNVPYAVIRLHMYCAAKEVRCFVTRARAQYRMRAFSISPLPLSPKHLRWRWRCISFHHIPRCVLCMQPRTAVVRSGPFVEKRRFFLSSFILPTIIVQPSERIDPRASFPSSHSYPGPSGHLIRSWLVARHHHHQWCLITPLLRLGDFLFPVSSLF